MTSFVELFELMSRADELEREIEIATKLRRAEVVADLISELDAVEADVEFIQVSRLEI